MMPPTASPSPSSPAADASSPDASPSSPAAPPADLVIGAFSDDAPWIVDPESMPWRRSLVTIRDVVRRQIPDLVRPRRWPGRRTARVGYELGKAVVLWWVVDRRRAKGDRSLVRAGISRRMRVAAETLGPTYIKLGQIISSGAGIFPEELVTEFAKCRDQVPAEDFDTVRRVLEEELGKRLEDVFVEFDRVPLAAASIAQVHRAVLHPSSPGGPALEVVVKVQRPDVGRLVHDDLRVMAWLAPFLVGRIPVTALANPPALVEVFAQTIAEELDFRLEAENMLDVAASLAALGQRGYVIPRPHPTLITRRMLVMERLSGYRFDDIDALNRAGIDTHAIIRTGLIGFMEGALLHGIFHGDLHGGNLFVLPDGRTALLDFGITGRLSEPRRVAFLRLLIAGTMNDVRGQLRAMCELGALPMDTDLDAVIADLNLEGPPLDPTAVSADDLIAEVQRVTKALVGYGARIPKELLLFVKNMVFLDGAIATLAPDLDLLGEIQHVALYFAQTHGLELAAQAGVDPNAWQFDQNAVKDAFGVDRSLDRLTYRDLQERRDLIRKRLESRRKK